MALTLNLNAVIGLMNNFLLSSQITVKYLLLILTILNSISCKLNEANIIGKYSSRNNFESSAQLIINSKSSYRYSQQSGLIFYKGTGNWKIIHDTLHLSNKDTSLDNGTPLPHQQFLIKGNKLIEIVNLRQTGLILKKSNGR